MIWFVVLGVIALTLVYIFVIRPVLVNAPFFSDAFKAEASLWTKVQAYITGRKTVMISRLVTIAGVLVGLYDQILPFISSQDWAPITAKLPGWVLPVVMMTTGIVFEYLRKVTENPPHVVTVLEDGQSTVVNVIPPTKVVP